MEFESSNLNPERHFLTDLIRFNKRIVRAKGNYLYDDRGASYLDFASQYGCVPFGYNPDFIWDVMARVRASDEPSFVQPLVSPAAEMLAQRLSEVSPGGKRHVVFTNSGAESVEVAVKLARARTGRRTILGTCNGFHGKTLGAVSATGNSIYRDPFHVDTTAFGHVPYDDVDALAARLSQGDVAAFIVEPVQGEGGMVTPAATYLSEVEKLCRQHGALFVLDEVQTGLGRTGRLFACEWGGANPDLILLAKALGGGLVPLGACLVAEHAWTKEFGLYHSSTFANNHLTCAVGLAVVNHLTENGGELVRHAEAVGDCLRARLEELVAQHKDVFVQVRGKGLMLGLELQPWSSEDAYFMGMVNYLGYVVPLISGYLLNEHGILALPTMNHNNVLRLQPALTIERDHVDRLIQALAEAAQLIRDGRFSSLFSYATGGKADAPARAMASMPNIRVVPQGERRLGRFAFLIHPTDFEDILRCMPSGCSNYPAGQRDALREWMDKFRMFERTPSAVYQIPFLRSKAGGYVDGWLISSLLTPREMMRLSRAERASLIADYLAVARDVGADRVGLGAFTSVITRAGADIADSDIPITTGNSLTALMCSEGLQSVARNLDRPLPPQSVAVIGAAGSVGRLAALDIAPHCHQLILFGNPANPNAIQNVQAVAGEIYQQLLAMDETAIPGSIRQQIHDVKTIGKGIPSLLAKASSEEAYRALFDFVSEKFWLRYHCDGPIRVSVTLPDDLPQARAVISATSNGKAFIDPSWLATDTIVCDAARPADMLPHIQAARRDLAVFEGGLVRLPEKVSFGRNNVLGHPAGINLACLSETIALTMAGTDRHYSIGHRVPLAEAHEVYRIARTHGFDCFVPQLVSTKRELAAV